MPRRRGAAASGAASPPSPAARAARPGAPSGRRARPRRARSYLSEGILARRPKCRTELLVAARDLAVELRPQRLGEPAPDGGPFIDSLRHQVVAVDLKPHVSP